MSVIDRTSAADGLAARRSLGRRLRRRKEAMTRFALYVFDAYGTLFDVHSAVARHRTEIGPDADGLSDLWRAKQLEYSWVRSLMGSYRDFLELTEAALDYATARRGGISHAM